VLLDREFNIKLIDFGLAEKTRTKENEKRKEILTTGTTGFIAPEQLYNDGSGKFCLMKCDIFALGVFLFILL
jgi:serine/threonine protein kinase